MIDSSTGCTSGNVVLVTCAILVALLSSAPRASEARPGPSGFSRFQVSDGKISRSERAPGFRQGAIDRIGHQFGKRSQQTDELDLLADQPDDFVMTDTYIANALSESPQLALFFVRRYVDTNGDGFVTSSELLSSD